MTNQKGFEVLTRLGFVARGVLYVAIGALVIFLGRAADTQGALRFLGDGLGHNILIVAAAGFAAYGLWRLADLFLGNEHPGSDRKAWQKRFGAGVSGVVHLILAYQTVKLAIGASHSTGGSDQTAATVLDLPAGQVILIGAAIGVAIAAFMQLKKAVGCDFLDHLVPRARENYVKWLGRLGYSARGIVFAIIAYYLLDAGLNGAPWKAGGTEQVFAWMPRYASLTLAAGLFLFGLYALVEAWFRNLHPPDIDHLARQARDKVSA